MQIEWLSMIQRQQRVARNAAADVMKQLANPDLSSDEASRLRNQIEIGSAALDTLLRALNAHVIDEAYFFAGAALKNFWSELAGAVSQRERKIACHPKPRPCGSN